jgi:hypothetical protein
VTDERAVWLHAMFESWRKKAIEEMKRRKHPRYTKSKEFWRGMAQCSVNARTIMAGLMNIDEKKRLKKAPSQGA